MTRCLKAAPLPDEGSWPCLKMLYAISILGTGTDFRKFTCGKPYPFHPGDGQAYFLPVTEI